MNPTFITAIKPVSVPLTVNNHFALIPYRNLAGGLAATKIDRADWERVRHYSWYENNWGFIQANTENASINLSHFIVQGIEYLNDHARSDLEVRYVNGDHSDNRRQNLQPLARSALNSLSNRKRYQGRDLPTGVYHRKDARRRKPYQACIKIHGRSKSLGWFRNASDAERAYNEAFEDLHGIESPTRNCKLPTMHSIA